MRLRRLDLTRYGKFTDFALDFGEARAGAPDFHIVYGLNEAGKSTAFAGYLDLLFGIEPQSAYAFLHGYDVMEIGAVLEIEGRAHTLRRLKQRAGSLKDATGAPVGEALLGGALAGLSREAYRTMFSLDDATLEEGGKAILDSKGDLGELLFAASAGLAGLNLRLAAAGQEAEALFRKRASKTEIATLKRRLADLKTDRDAIDIQAGAHARLVAALGVADAEYEAATAELGRLKVEAETLDGLIRAAPQADSFEALGRELETLADLPRPPAYWTDRLPALMVAQATLRERQAAAAGRVARLKAEIDAIRVEEPLLTRDAGLDTLQGLLGRFQAAQDDLPKRRADLAQREAQLRHATRALGQDVDPQALMLDAATLDRLQSLLERWSGIDAGWTAARQERAAAALALDEAREDHAALLAAHPPLAPTAAAELRARLGRVREAGWPAQRRRAAEAAADAVREADAALAALAPWRGSIVDLSSMAAPLPRQMQDWRETLTRFALQREGHDANARTYAAEEAILSARLAAMETGLGPVSDEAAERLRRAREDAWAAHLETLDGASAGQFERAMRDLDTISQARLTASDRLAEIRGLTVDLATARTRAAHETQARDDLDQRIGALTAAVTGFLPAALAPAPSTPAPSTPADALARLEDWVARRAQALAACETARLAASALEAIDMQIAQERTALALTLRAAGVEAGEADLGVLLQAAEACLARDAAQAEARAAAEKAVAEAGRKLKARLATEEAEAQARASWLDDWTRALNGTWLAARASDLDAVRALLRPLAGLPADLAARDELRHRIGAMEADCTAFRDTLGALLQDLGEAGEGDATSARQLLDRRAAARHARSARDEKLKDRAAALQDLDRLNGEIRLHEAETREVLTLLAASDLMEAELRLRLCARRDQIEDKREALAALILRDTGAATLEAAQDRLAADTVEDRAKARAVCEARIGDLETRRQTLFAQRQAAADRLAGIGGDDAVARLDAARRTVMMEIEDKAVRYLHLKTGILLAERALQSYRDTHRGSMMRRASEAFREMTRGAYAGLATLPEKDRETLIALPEGGGSKNADHLSKGTRFQLYLALRVAGYEEFAASHAPVPFIADDIMETFDEPRAQEVLALFAQMARRGQVIYLTHHRHVCDLAAQVAPDCRIHELPSSA